MITITNLSRDFNEVEQYLMTIDSGITSMKDVEDGTSIPVNGYLEFIDQKEDGSETEVMSIITPDNKVYSCQSATFKRKVHDIERIMNGKPFSVIKTSGTTKAGRPYIDCSLDVTSVQV